MYMIVVWFIKKSGNVGPHLLNKVLLILEELLPIDADHDSFWEIFLCEFIVEYFPGSSGKKPS